MGSTLEFVVVVVVVGEIYKFIYYTHIRFCCSCAAGW